MYSDYCVFELSCVSLLRWLDSSKTLFEQDVKDGDLLFLRFKYYPFMDIDPRVSGRIGTEWVGGSCKGLLVQLSV